MSVGNHSTILNYGKFEKIAFFPPVAGQQSGEQAPEMIPQLVGILERGL
ncbi:MAG: hypothetical protein ACOC0C_01690 [Bacteroidota bacterium]